MERKNEKKEIGRERNRRQRKREKNAYKKP